MCDVKGIARNMPDDEKKLFLSIFEKENAKVLETALKKTRVQIEVQRKERREAAKKRLEEIGQEIPALQKVVSDWYSGADVRKDENHAGTGIIPERVGRIKNQLSSLFQEQEKLKSIVG